jgi:Ca-activated chloride channel homolog
MNFARPWLLLLVTALPLWWVWRARRLRRTPGLPFSDVALLQPASVRQWLGRAPLALRSACLGLWILGAAGPRFGEGVTEVKREGIAIVLAVDVSESMLAQDFPPSSRLEVARRTAVEFVRSRSSDRIGLVAFAGEALTQVPITTDYDVLDRAILELRVGTLDDGTAIGTAIATAANRVRRAPEKSKVIVLLTDGENNRGATDPRTAAAAAAQFGLKIYTIGIGSRGEALVPSGMGAQGMRYRPAPVTLDEPLLADVAAATGGRYFRATDAHSLQQVFEQIDQLEKTATQRVVYHRRDEALRWPLAIGLLLLGLELVLSSTLVVRVP